MIQVMAPYLDKAFETTKESINESNVDKKVRHIIVGPVL